MKLAEIKVNKVIGIEIHKFRSFETPMIDCIRRRAICNEKSSKRLHLITKESKTELDKNLIC